uniref:non-specific serine/threonine protein kinase n=1 Tax=Araucaria cunninghamii TaxID=56994 RepID=A0A0D6R857_ARACU
MKCFHFSHSERKEDPRNNTNISANRKSIWTRSWSGGSNPEGRRYSSDINSQTISTSDVSIDSPGPAGAPQRPPHNLQVFSYSELKSATRNFSRHLMLGEGGFGCVYRGWVKSLDDPHSKIEVAVKQLNRKGLQGHKEWVTEVHFLGLVEHPNLVKLVGYCAEDDERGIQRLLVYEFMPNKSLEDHLLSRALPVLPWTLRLQIALGAARGLAYLHEEMDFQIIFRDLKTSNILLDGEFHPKLSDFGLARQGPAGGISHVSTAVVGTVGYAAPEYVQTGHLTSKSDVWSFGVVLYELITGRRSMDRNRPKNEQKLLEWVKAYISDSKKFHMIVDPRLEGQYSLKSAQKLASLANSCLVRHPKSRPKMSEVAETLKQIVEATEAESPQATIDCQTVEDSTEILTQPEPTKGSVNSKRRMLLLRDMINLRSRENGRPAWRAWAPKMVKTW